jgi:hypothetical protein
LLDLRPIFARERDAKAGPIHPVNNAQTFRVTVGTKIRIVYGSGTIFAPPQTTEFCRKSEEWKIPCAGLSWERVSKEISKRGLPNTTRHP